LLPTLIHECRFDASSTTLHVSLKKIESLDTRIRELTIVLAAGLAQPLGDRDKEGATPTRRIRDGQAGEVPVRGVADQVKNHVYDPTLGVHLAVLDGASRDLNAG
jgi:hypothetical protein